MKKTVKNLSVKALAGRLLDTVKPEGIRNKKLEQQLTLMSPGVAANILVREYYISKIENILKLGGAAVLLTIVLGIGSREGIISEDSKIKRGDYGNEAVNIELEASSSSTDYGILNYSLRAIKYKEEEVLELMEKCSHSLEDYIRGGNESLERVVEPLTLPLSVEGYPFSIRWESSNYSLMHENGSFGDEQPDESGSSLILRAILSYEEYSGSYDYHITLFPKALTKEEKDRNILLEELNKMDKNTETAEYFQLPQSINGEIIDWKESKTPVVPMMMALSVVLLIGVWIGTDNDTEKRYMQRNKALALEYSEFVSRLSLLLGSGMTIRGSLIRMASDYRNKISEGRKRKYVYEELLVCTKKLQEGMREEACYEYFGMRCGLPCYKKLVAILNQNLRKGNEGLIKALREEGEAAFEERKAIARQLGEEAQTKLIFPMMLMLGVVMVIIMIPAYMSFGGM